MGVSNGQFFEKHLKYIKLADKSVGVGEWRQALKPLVDKPVYDQTLVSVLSSTLKISQFDLNKRCNVKPSSISGKNLSDREKSLLDSSYSYFRIEYNSENEFKSAAKTLGLMTDSKSGVPRTASMGVIESQFQN